VGIRGILAEAAVVGQYQIDWVILAYFSPPAEKASSCSPYCNR
jgi:hypothetical protein